MALKGNTMNNERKYLNSNMNRALTLIFLGLVFYLPVRADDIKSPEGGLLDYVNILQGTDSAYQLSHGNTLPLVGMPWGMIDWAIENDKGSWYLPPEWHH